MFLCNEILSKHYDTPKYVAGKCNINVTKLALSLINSMFFEVEMILKSSETIFGAYILILFYLCSANLLMQMKTTRN